VGKTVLGRLSLNAIVLDGGTMHSQVEKIAAATLLHDTGKFSSRVRFDPLLTRQERDHVGPCIRAFCSVDFTDRHIDDADVALWVPPHHVPDYEGAHLISSADRPTSGGRKVDPGQDIGRTVGTTSLPRVRWMGNIYRIPGQSATSPASRMPARWG